MSFSLKPATKRVLKLRIALSAPSGAGKTYGALMLASGIAPWEKIAVIDTENGSANYYADLGPYNVMEFGPPYTPERYIESIRAAEAAGMEVVIVDSISHEWAGKGGVLDIKDSLTGNDFAKWARLTPRHEAFVDAMRTSSCHLIATIRAKQDYEVQETGGRIQVQKLGMAPMQRDGIEYEFGISFSIDMKHNATASKDRTGLFDGRPEFHLSAETGRELLNWANSTNAEPVSEAQAAELTRLAKDVCLPDQRERVLRTMADWTQMEAQSEIAALEKLLSTRKDLLKRTVEGLKACADAAARQAKLQAVDPVRYAWLLEHPQVRKLVPEEGKQSQAAG